MCASDPKVWLLTSQAPEWLPLCGPVRRRVSGAGRTHPVGL